MKLKKHFFAAFAAAVIMSQTACSGLLPESITETESYTQDGSSAQTTPEATETVPDTSESTAPATSTVESTSTLETTPEDTATQDEPETEGESSSSEQGGPFVPKQDDTIQIVYEKYAHLLAVKIDTIDVENYFTIYDPNGDPDMPMQVLIEDIYGDIKPEIIFVENNDDGVGSLQIAAYTFYGETIEELFRGTVDIAAGGGMNFCLFTSGDDKIPWLLIRSGEYKTVTTQVIELDFSRSENSEYIRTGDSFACVENDEDAEPEERQDEDKWGITDKNGTISVTKEEYYERLNPILNDASPMIHNYRGELPEFLQGKAMRATSYSEALEFLLQ